MTTIKMLAGSLSNDLFRVATLKQRGSNSGAARFLQEAKRWSVPLQKQHVAKYIQDIAQKVSLATTNNISLPQAELYLMYGILLQNYSLHSK